MTVDAVSAVATASDSSASRCCSDDAAFDNDIYTCTRLVHVDRVERQTVSR
jgi:hypothetical protein